VLPLLFPWKIFRAAVVAFAFVPALCARSCLTVISTFFFLARAFCYVCSAAARRPEFPPRRRSNTVPLCVLPGPHHSSPGPNPRLCLFFFFSKDHPLFFFGPPRSTSWWFFPRISPPQNHPVFFFYHQSHSGRLNVAGFCVCPTLDFAYFFFFPMLCASLMIFRRPVFLPLALGNRDFIQLGGCVRNILRRHPRLSARSFSFLPPSAMTGSPTFSLGPCRWCFRSRFIEQIFPFVWVPTKNLVKFYPLFFRWFTRYFLVLSYFWSPPWPP